MIYADDGTVYVVFHTTEAGSPSFYERYHGKHGWVFESTDWEYGAYSKIYDTKEDAEIAAEDTNTRLVWEIDPDHADKHIYALGS